MLYYIHHRLNLRSPTVLSLPLLPSKSCVGAVYINFLNTRLDWINQHFSYLHLAIIRILAQKFKNIIHFEERDTKSLRCILNFLLISSYKIKAPSITTHRSTTQNACTAIRCKQLLMLIPSAPLSTLWLAIFVFSE